MMFPVNGRQPADWDRRNSIQGGFDTYEKAVKDAEDWADNEQLGLILTGKHLTGTCYVTDQDAKARRELRHKEIPKKAVPAIDLVKRLMAEIEQLGDDMVTVSGAISIHHGYSHMCDVVIPLGPRPDHRASNACPHCGTWQKSGFMGDITDTEKYWCTKCGKHLNPGYADEVA
jgi:hypothetical protein